MILQRWKKLSTTRWGRALFNRGLGWFIPYTGTIRPEVLEIGEDYSKVALHDRRGVRNHLDCVHAVALMNLSELSTGLALYVPRSDRLRMILAGFDIEYLKKARGTITAHATCPKFDEAIEQVVIVSTELRDASGDVVCRARGHWKVSPLEKT